ncbi:MAG: SusD/RagB family nutrient-binding outer membrane lipoprotein [Balneolaceae bacterium]
MLFSVQCEVIDSDLLNDPNAASLDNVDPDFLLNNVQIFTQEIYSNASTYGAEVSRMRYMFGSTYGNADDFTPQAFDLNRLYEESYSDMLIDVENLIPIAEERELYFHSGMAKTLKAYVLITLVDLFGDVPFSEALDAENFNPGLDDGQDIYNTALGLLDEAIADFQNENRRAFPQNDLFYSGHTGDAKVDAWVRAANTIKLKAYLNTGNTSEINSLISSGNLILTNANNFTFDFSSNDVNPDSRHPEFIDTYINLPSGGNYMAVNYLNFMLNDKNQRDPRTRYYFYRQSTSNPTDANENTCIGASKPGHFDEADPFCLLSDGYWGRDHLIDDGIPPDAGLRTTFGVYPVGGQFDANQGQSVTPGMGYQGAGFEPFMMASYTHFMLAEAAQNLGAQGNPREYLRTALELSFEAVLGYGAAQAAGSGFEPSEGAVNTYINTVVDDRFDSQGPMRTINKEYYLALWPNGIETYNLLRRTGFGNRNHPDKLQPARANNPGDWYRTLSYPSDLIDRNSNVGPKDNRRVGPFWDPNNGSEEFNF